MTECCVFLANFVCCLQVGAGGEAAPSDWEAVKRAIQDIQQEMEGYKSELAHMKREHIQRDQAFNALQQEARSYKYEAQVSLPDRKGFSTVREAHGIASIAHAVRMGARPHGGYMLPRLYPKPWRNGARCAGASLLVFSSFCINVCLMCSTCSLLQGMAKTLECCDVRIQRLEKELQEAKVRHSDTHSAG